MSVTSSGQIAPASTRGWAARHPLTTFALLVFGVGWPSIAAVAVARRPYGPDGGVIVGRPVEEWLSLALVALVMVPAAAWAIVRSSGARGLREWWRRAVRWRVGIGWGLLVTVALPLVAMLLALLGGARWREGVDVTTVAVVGSYAWSLASRTLLINLWEELVWAGFVQSTLRRRHGVVAAAALTAIPFAGVHVPMMLLSHEPLLVRVAALLVLAVAFRLLIGLVLDATRGSVLAVAVMHASFNESNNPEGVLRAFLTGVDLTWQAIAAVAILAALLGLRPTRHRRTSDAG